MAILRSDGGVGGRWLKLQGTRESPAPEGKTYRGVFLGFQPEVPSANPAFPAQDILHLDMDGDETLIPCPASLGRVFKNNKVEVGTPLKITYQGRRKGKMPVPFHCFEVATEGQPKEDASFAPAGFSEVPAMTAEEQELERRLTEARTRRSA